MIEAGELRRVILQVMAEVLQEAEYVRRTQTGDLVEAFRIAVERQQALGPAGPGAPPEARPQSV